MGGDSLQHLLQCTVMLNAMDCIRPFLRSAWVVDGRPPLLPNFTLRALGIGCMSLEEASDVLLWHDFLHHVYSSRCQINHEVSSWRFAWAARARVLNRYGAI